MGIKIVLSRPILSKTTWLIGCICNSWTNQDALRMTNYEFIIDKFRFEILLVLVNDKEEEFRNLNYVPQTLSAPITLTKMNKFTNFNIINRKKYNFFFC